MIHDFFLGGYLYGVMNEAPQLSFHVHILLMDAGLQLMKYVTNTNGEIGSLRMLASCRGE